MSELAIRVFGSPSFVVIGFRSLHVDVQMSGWWEIRPAKEDWKSDLAYILGEQSVTINSTTLMLELPAIVLDSGRCSRRFSLQSTQSRANVSALNAVSSILVYALP